MTQEKTTEINKKAEDLRQQIEHITALRKKRKFSRSRLNKYLTEIFILKFENKVSYSTIALWLRKHKRIKITKHAVRNFVVKHEKEIKENDDNNQYTFLKKLIKKQDK